jgi:heat shock protein HtpX
MTPRSDFWALERANRRQSAILVALFVGFFAALGVGLDFLVGNLRVISGQLIGFPFLTVVALIIGGVQSVASYWGGAAMVLASVGARELTPDTPRHQMVLDVVREMALAAQLPVPKAYVMDDPAPNAFATGRDPEHSVICVTQGLVDAMDREQLQGVLGHEMAHIRDYDIRTMTMVAVLVGGIAMLADMVYFSMFAMPVGIGGDNDSGGGGALVMLTVFVLSAVASLFAQIVAMAVSREREYLADASSVEFTRNPRALLRALEHIAQIESPVRNVSRGIAHLFMVNPYESAVEDDEGFFDNLFSSHPPLSKRIARLRALLGAEAPATAKA